MKRIGVTLVELIIGMTLTALIAGFFSQWFISQKNYQQRLTRVSEVQENFRRASWSMIQELQVARVIVWPRMNPDNSIRTDAKVVFKNFKGEIVSFYFVPEAREIRRCVIPIAPGDVTIDPKPLGTGIDNVSFTSSDVENRLLSMHLEAEGVHALEAVYLLNSD